MNGVMQLKDILFYPVGISKSCSYAASLLKISGIPITDHPTPEITHLLLDIPSFRTDGKLQDGSDFCELLRMLPAHIQIFGGNLNTPALKGYPVSDLLKDEIFLAKNALITAECALQISSTYINNTFSDSSALILGWGRIGKHLSNMLLKTGCKVTVASRNPRDRGLLETFGFRAVDFQQIPAILSDCNILYNTVPEPTVPPSILDQWKNGVIIDLASSPGMLYDEAIIARGLPGKYAPESAGRLIAQTVLRLL